MVYSRKRLRVGIIGCGAIGREIALACAGRLRGKVTLVAICDADKKKAEELAKRLSGDTDLLEREELIKKSDLVVEAASAKVSSGIVRECIMRGKDVLVMSVGGLLEDDSLLSRIRRATSKVYIPSGAICGIDGVKAASIGAVRSVSITTRKPTKSLGGAPYIVKHGIDLDKIDMETTLFEGSAEEAVSAFPQNINVAATLSLAAIGGKGVKVRIVTSPDYTKNVHEVEVVGDFGSISTKTENIPSAKNPKTSQLAILSAVATLERIVSNLQVGT